VKPAPQCAPQSKDAETCKKSKSEIFAVTGFLHPTDDMRRIVRTSFRLCIKSKEVLVV